MKLVIEIDYTGQRVLTENADCPLFEVTASGTKKLCLTIDAVVSHTAGLIQNAQKDILTTKET